MSVRTSSGHPGADRQRRLLQPLPRLRAERRRRRSAARRRRAGSGSPSSPRRRGCRWRSWRSPVSCAVPLKARLVGADRARLRVGVGDPRDRVVVDRPVLAEDVRGDDLALVLADVGQRPGAVDVADRPEALVGDAQVVVDLDPVRVGLDPDRLQADALDPRAAAGGDEDAVAAQLAAVVERRARSPRRRGARRSPGRRAPARSLRARSSSPSASPSGAGSRASRCGGAVDHGRAAAEPVHRLRQLDPGRAAAEHQQVPRHRFHAGRLARPPDAVELPQSRHRRHERRGAVGQHHVAGGVAGAVDLDRAGPGEPARRRAAA